MMESTASSEPGEFQGIMIEPSVSWALEGVDKRHSSDTAKSSGMDSRLSSNTAACSTTTRARSYDFFLSHKKSHSKLGRLPEQVAQNLHDALEIYGYEGFFDVDDLEEISQESIAEAIRRSKVMIVYMTNETMQSQWCAFEWETANALNIPIKVVVDLNNFLKNDIISDVKQSPYQFLLQYQWMEYTDSNRRPTIHAIAEWIADASGKTGAQAGEFLFTDKGALCIREGDHEFQLFHPLFEYYMVAVGFVYNPEAWSRRMLLWTRVVRFMSVGCFLICFWRLAYATGPAYTDWYSCLYVVLIHVFLFHGLILMMRFLTSPAMLKLLKLIAEGDMAAWTAKRIHTASKWTAIAAFSIGSATALSMIAIYLPLFLSDFYLSESGIAGVAFGLSSAFFFIMVAPIVLVQEMAVLALLALVIEMERSVFETAVASLNHMISNVGLDSFVHAGNKVMPTQLQVDTFGDRWSGALELRSRLQSAINPVLYVHVPLNLVGIMIPCAYVLVIGEPFEDADFHWTAWAKPLTWWGFAIVCYTVSVLLPVMGNAVRGVAHNARCLKMTSKAKEFVLLNMQIDLTWAIFPLRMTDSLAVLLMVPALLSLVCWSIMLHRAIV